MNDPLGDMFTRIRNAQMRGKSQGLYARLPACAKRVLDVLQNEGYIRGYAPWSSDGRSEFEIELKYLDGEPAIREIERVSKPGRRVYSSVSDCRASTTVSASRSCRPPRA